MLRRSILEISHRRCARGVPRHITTQIPSFLSSRKEFSTASHQNASRGPSATSKPSESKSILPKIVIGSVVVGAAATIAYQTGYLDQFLGKQEHGSWESVKIDVGNKNENDVEHLVEPIVLPSSDDHNSLSTKAEQAEQKIETHSDVPHPEALSEREGENQFQAKDKSDVTPEENTIPVQVKDMPEYPHSSVTSDAQSADSTTSSEASLDMKSLDTKTGMEQTEGVQTTPISNLASAVPEENETNAMPPQHLTTEDMPEDTLGKGVEPPSPLLDAYCLREKADESTATSSNGQGTNFAKEKETLVSTVEDLNDVYVLKDGKLVLDFLHVIHAAEKRQAELDAHVFAEEKRMMKEKYEKQLKDARARQLMYAEEAAILDKELNKERVKAAAAIKSLQEKAEEKLKMELEQKESEAEQNLKKFQELAKAELAATIASEKASQIEKMAEADLHINALCMAFYAQSEESRQSHSVHKLALGALALEDALSKGLPVQTEIEALHTYLEAIDRDSLIDLVLSSLPDETRNYGTDTLLQLNQKFDNLKGTLRHYSLIPPGGGGILAHSLAHIASWLKVKEVDQSGDGIESVINRVESYLADGKLAEAAETLEEGVRGSQAEKIIGDWVRRARNRAITEQTLTLLQSYATSISLT
ncbi:hypothetical protein L1049_002013 [Liquidambar formosana]|uniref:MICOS complex subunit MIC60 n=1 Tax=Liquidambar formosana TaxID=63359 RepID=A0AAP0R720_LIQFO